MHRRWESFGGGRKNNFPHIEQEFLNWMIKRREAGVRITGKSMKLEARRLHSQNGNQFLKAVVLGLENS
jgi:hypothetical protein